jgi:hypothetical protein
LKSPTSKAFGCRLFFSPPPHRRHLDLSGPRLQASLSGLLLRGPHVDVWDDDRDHFLRYPAAAGNRSGIQDARGRNLVLGSSFGIGFGIPILILVGLAPKSDMLCWLTLLLCVVYFLLLVGFIYKVHRKKKS